MRPRLRLIIIGIIAALFVVGIVQLFMLRFKAGDIYPPYSSLRSDPLGTKVFYASLQRFNDLQVQRNFARLSTLPTGNGATLFFLGSELGRLTHASESFFKQMDLWVATGGRLVISLRPPAKKKVRKKSSKTPSQQDSESKPPDEDQKQAAEDNDAKTDENRSTEEKPSAENENEKRKKKSKSGFTSLKEQWGVTIGIEPTDPAHNQGVTAVPSVEMPFDNVDWHSGFKVLAMTSNWQPILSVGDQPVMIERRLRRGSIVLATDSFFFSNEALSGTRNTPLLTWLLGGRSKIIFDERHLGVVHSPGLAKLVRHYRFHWFAASALLLMALFIWKNARPFIPARGQDHEQSFDYASDKDSYQGLISLLRRNLPAGRILSVCIAEWKKTIETNRSIPESNIKAVDTSRKNWDQTGGADQDPVSAYRRLSKIVMEGNRPNAK